MTGTNVPQTWGIYAPGFETIVTSDPRAQDAAVAVNIRPDPSQLWSANFVAAAPYAAQPSEHRIAFMERIRAAIAENGPGQYWYVLERAGFWSRNIYGASALLPAIAP